MALDALTRMALKEREEKEKKAKGTAIQRQTTQSAAGTKANAGGTKYFVRDGLEAAAVNERLKREQKTGEVSVRGNYLPHSTTDRTDPVSRYYSSTELNKNLDRLRGDIDATEPTYLERQKQMQSAVDQLERISEQVKNNPGNEDLYNIYSRVYDDYTRMWEEFEPLQNRYSTAVNAYNNEYKNWKGSIRSADEIAKELAELDERAKLVQRDLGVYKSASINEAGPVDATELNRKVDALTAELDAIKAQRALLVEERNMSEHFSFADLAENTDFQQYTAKGAALDKPAEKAEYMTEDEVGIYNYILAKDGEAAAQEYLDHLEEYVNQRKGAEIGESVRGIDNGLLRTGATALYGLAAGVGQFAGGIQQLFTSEDRPTSAFQYGSQYIQEDLEGSRAGKYLYGAATTVGNMAPSILVASLTGGLGAPAAAASAVGSATMGASAAGNAYGQKLAEGYSKGQARTYSTLVGAAEGALQYLLGGIGKLGGVTDDLLLAKVNAIDNAFARVAATGAVKLGSEIAEEELQNFIEPLIASVIFNENYDAPTVEELVETAIVTALSTAVLESADIARTERAKDNVGGEYQVAAEDLINEGLTFAPDTSAYKAAQALKAKLDKGEAVSNRELANLVAANDRAIHDNGAGIHENGADIHENGAAIQNNTPIVRNDTATVRNNTPTVAENETVEPVNQPLMDAAMKAAGAKETQSVPFNVLSDKHTAAQGGVRGAMDEVAATRKKIEQKLSQPKYGTHGMQAFSEIVENSTENYDKVRTQFERAYQAGLVELPRNSISLVNDVQEKAYQAGRQDYILSLADSQRKGATVWGKEGGLVQNSESQKLDKGVQTQLDRWGRATGTKIIVDSRLAGTRQNGYYSNGEIHLSPDANKPLMVVARHEITHHLQVAAPEAYTAFRNYAIQKMNEGAPYGSVTISEDMRGRYLEASEGDVDLSTEEAMDEVAAHFAEKLLSDEKAMDDFVREVSKSKDTRTWAQKFFDAVHDFVEKVKKAFGKGKKADQAVLDEYGITVEQFEKAEKLWQDAIRAAGENSLKTAGNGSTMNTKYSMKENGNEKENTRQRAGAGRGDPQTQRRSGENDTRRTENAHTKEEGVRREAPSFDKRQLERLRGLTTKEKIAVLESYRIEPRNGSVAESIYKIAVDEYQTETFVVPDEVWLAAFSPVELSEPAPAASYNGKIYVQESIDEEAMEVVAHELTHILKQKNFAPYLAFLEEPVTKLDISKPDGTDLAELVMEHLLVPGEDGKLRQMELGDLEVDFDEADPQIFAEKADRVERNALRFADELAATVYGVYASGQVAGYTRKGYIDLRQALRDYDSYTAELAAVHERFRHRNDGKKFSLKNTVEETKTLVALHNLTADKLLKALKLGGFPMPSIAVTKADIPHTNFGDITLVMDKRTVDPKASRKNTVYSADAWTPTFPKVDYEVNRDVEYGIYDRADAAAGAIPAEYLSAVRRMAGSLDHYLNTYETEEGVKERLGREYAFKALYLADKGEKVETKTREVHNEKARSEMLEAVLELFEEEDIWHIPQNELHAKYAEDIKRALMAHGRTEEQAEKMVAKKGGMFGFGKLMSRLYDYANAPASTTETVTDTKAMEQDIDSRIDPKAYDKWLSNMLSGLVKDSGIYNGKDIFTPSGNRRTFKQTHYPVTLDNIAKAMAAQNGGSTKNVMGFVGVKSLRAGTAERFKSIADMHKREGRLKHLSEEENAAIIDALDKRLVDVMDRIYESSSHKNERERWMMLDSIGNILMEVTEQPKYTVDSISKVFDQYGYKLGNQLAMDIRDLLFDVSEMPVNLFEAKPERAVRFDEVLAAVVPNTVPAELRNGLEQAGVRVMEYQEGNDADRLAKVNSVDDARFSLKEQESLRRENAKLKEVNQTLREQFKTTKFAKVDKKALDKFTKDLLKDYASGADINDTRNALDELYTYIANGEGGESPVWDVAYRRAYEAAMDILGEVGMMNDDLYQQYKSLRQHLRTTGLTISDADKPSLSSYGGYEEFRRANFGRLKLVNNGLPVDTAYEELATIYPEFFDSYHYTHPADQLLHIVEVLDSLQPYQINPYESNMREAATWLANDIMERFFELPQAKPTFADKAERKLTQQVIKDQKKLNRLREQKNERIAEIIQNSREKVKKVQAKERQKRLEAVKQTKEHYQTKEKRMSESRQATVLRTRIQRHAADLSKKLLHPTDKQHIPEDLREAVAALLENINLESQYTIDEMGKRHKGGDGEPVKRTELFRQLAEQYQRITKEGSMVVDPSLLGDEETQGNFTKAIALGETRIADMGVEDLSTIWSVIRAVEHSITTANRVLSKAKFQETSDWANSLNDEAQSRRAMKGKGIEEIRLNLENPYTFFSHYGEAGQAIFRMLRDAQDHQQEMVQAVKEEVDKIVDPKTVKKLEETAYVFTTERGDKLTLTTAHMMEIHLLMKREQARDHLLKGGIVQPEIKAKKIVRGNDAILLTYGDLGKIVGKLTPDQLKIAESLQALTRTTLAEYGNEASMKAYGYKKFTGSDYWPIKSAKEGIHSNIEKGGNNTRSIKNIGLAKSVMPHASNQLDIRGIFETFAGHAADMTDYAAWLCPMEDANRLYNFDFRDNEGNKTGKTMKGLLDKVGGKGAQEYWHNLMEDIQNGLNPPSDTWFGKAVNQVVGNVKGASVGANIRVIVQQPTAILRAAVVLSPGDMVKGLAQTGGWKAALEHSAIAQRKDMGGFDISSPMQMGEILFDKRTNGRKFNDAMMSGAGAADAFAWGRVWRACEANIKRTRPKLKVGSDTYYEAVDALFTEVVDQSQVVDGVLQRSQVMRSGDAVIKQATSFMGEPAMALNMALRAYDGWRNESDPQKRTAAKKMLSRTIVVLVATNAVNALAQSLVDAWRDDEDDEKYKERVWRQFVGLTGDEESAWEKAVAVVLSGNLGSSLNPMTYVPIAKDLVSLLSGYDVSRMDADVMADVIKATQTFLESIGGNGKKTRLYGLKEFAHNIFRACGISATNIIRDVWGFMRSVVVETGNIGLLYKLEKVISNIEHESNNSRYIDILHKAYAEEHGSYEYIYEDMIANGIDPDKIATGMETRMKKAQGVTKVGDLERRYLAPDKQDDYDALMRTLQNNGLWNKAAAEQRKELEEDVYELVNGKDEDLQKKINEGADYGLSETEYLLYNLALTMVDQPNGSGNLGGAPTLSEKAAAIEEVGTLSDSDIAYLWDTEEGFEAFAEGIDMETYARFKAYESTTYADKDKNGKSISGSKKKKVRKWLNDNEVGQDAYDYFMYEVMDYKK